MAVSIDKLARLSDVQRNRLESLLFDFDQTWTAESMGHGYQELARDDDHYRQAAVEEMVKVDMERCWSSGIRPKIEDYLKRFPELGTRETVSLQLIQTEYEIRQQYDLDFELAEFEYRFLDRVDELRLTIQLSHNSDSVTPAQSSIDTSHLGNSTETHAAKRGQTNVLPESFGRYQIIRQLGEGAMGSVYLALDTQLGREVALKTPHFSGDDADKLVQRFYREARTAATLRHPQICPIYDVGEIGGVHYITMAFVDGHTLSEYIREDKRPTERIVAKIVRKVALALEHAHGKGIVHRDLKPANIIIDQNREPLLMDFGLACRTDGNNGTRITQTGALLGTPAYMSPEQIEGSAETVGPPSDIYGLGVILYELLTGRLPFDGSVGSVIGKILTQEPPKPSIHRPELDTNLETICLKMMAKRVEDRYQSMAEVAESLSQFLQDNMAIAADKARAESDTNRVEGGPEKRDATKGEPKSMDEFKGSQGRNLSQLKERWHRLPPKLQWLTGTVVALLLVATVIVIRTPNGILRLDIGDAPPGLTVIVDGTQLTDEKLKKPLELRPRGHTLQIRLGGRSFRPGETILLKDGGRSKLKVQIGDVEMIGERFEIISGETLIVKVSLKPLPAPKLLGDYADLDNAVECVKFIPGKGSSFIAGDKNRLILRDGEKTREIPSPEPKWISDFSISADGKWLLVGNWGSGGIVRLQSIETGKENIRFDQHTNGVFGVDITADGKLGISGSWDKTIRLWDLEKGREILQFKDVNELVDSVAFSPDGHRALSGGRNHIVRLWNVDEGSKIRDFIGHTKFVTSVVFSGDGQRALSGSWDTTVRLWDVETGKLIRLFEGHTSPVWCVAFSPDGRFVFSGSGEEDNKKGDNTVRIWDTETGLEVHRLGGHADAVRTIDVSSDGRFLLSGSKDKRVRLWQLPEAWANVLSKQPDIKNSIGMNLRLIPKGEFDMGSENGDENEKPIHHVTITKPFYMGTHEVTQGEYRAVMGTNPSKYGPRDNLPVEFVTWENAVEFCQKLSKMEDRLYRLPTEAEWEYSCRAGTTTKWSFGDDPSVISQYAWVNKQGGETTHAVGRLKPNGFGLYDMHGNVVEYCSDWEGPYDAAPETDPTGAKIGRFHGFRGGSWFFATWDSRSANRQDKPWPRVGTHVGFRVLLEVAPTSHNNKSPSGLSRR